MAAILEPETFEAWLDPHQDRIDLLGLPCPAADEILDLYLVSGDMYKPGTEGKECIKPKVRPG